MTCRGASRCSGAVGAQQGRSATNPLSLSARAEAAEASSSRAPSAMSERISAHALPPPHGSPDKGAPYRGALPMAPGRPARASVEVGAMGATNLKRLWHVELETSREPLSCRAAEAPGAHQHPPDAVHTRSQSAFTSRAAHPRSKGGARPTWRILGLSRSHHRVSLCGSGHGDIKFAFTGVFDAAVGAAAVDTVAATPSVARIARALGPLGHDPSPSATGTRAVGTRPSRGVLADRGRGHGQPRATISSGSGGDNPRRSARSTGYVGSECDRG